MNFARIAFSVAFGLSSGVLCAAAPKPVIPTTFDLTQPLGDLPGVTTQSAPGEIAQAMQSRVSYLDAHQSGGRIILPAGTWRIDRPIFLTGTKELIGEGTGKTILQAADGYGAMPMVNMGVHLDFPARPIQAANRVALTAAEGRVLDSSVGGDRWGLRTYVEFPSDQFPAKSHLTITASKPGPWAKGNHYKLNDVISPQLPAAPSSVLVVCVKEHTASPENQPFKGAEWKQFWVMKSPFHIQFFSDPFTAGAYNPDTHRASDWSGMEHFTLDFAFTLNAEPKIYNGARMLCGVIMNDARAAANRVWSVDLLPSGQLKLNFTLAGGASKSIVLAEKCAATGTYRLALQVDFPARTVACWVRKPGDADFARSCDDRTTLPDGSHFQPLHYGYFVVAGGDSGAPASNGSANPPLDMTVCGLHTSAALRYADGDALHRRDGEGPVDDNFRYFTADAGTLAFLPLTDHPPDNQLATAGLLVTEQCGAASGAPGQKGYGYLKVPAGIWGLGSDRVSDMTIKPGGLWGGGIVTWHTLSANLSDLDVRGGYFAIGDLFYGAQYVFDIRGCRLSGSEAAYNGAANIVYMKDTTIDPVGRCGILVNGSNMYLDGVHFSDPGTFHSEYYFRHLGSVDYGGMNLLTDVHADAPKGSQFPSRAAFSQCTIWGSRTSMILRDCSVSNLGPGAAFLDLPYIASPCSPSVLMDRCTYSGNPIPAWVRSDSPWWSGLVHVQPAAPVQKQLEYTLPQVEAWKAAAHYRVGSIVNYQRAVWRSLKEHTSSADNAPAAAEYWMLAVPQIRFVSDK